MRPGQVLKIIATDPAADRDFRDFCRFLNHELIETDRDGERLDVLDSQRDDDHALLRVRQQHESGACRNAAGCASSRVEAARLADVALVFDKASRDHPQVRAREPRVRAAASRVRRRVVSTSSTPTRSCKMDPFERTPINYSREVVRRTDGRRSTWPPGRTSRIRRVRRRVCAPTAPTSIICSQVVRISPTTYFEWLRSHAVCGRPVMQTHAGAGASVRRDRRCVQRDIRGATRP